jgi:hypothetical protein
MALIAEDAADRVGQLIIITERLAALVKEETRLIEARAPLPEGAPAEEKARLANTYRFELARIKQDTTLVNGAPPRLLDDLKRRTGDLNEALAAHEMALGAVKIVAEGLVQAMAAEVARQRGQQRGYDASGQTSQGAAPAPVVIDRST